MTVWLVAASELLGEIDSVLSEASLDTPWRPVPVHEKDRYELPKARRGRLRAEMERTVAEDGAPGTHVLVLLDAQPGIGGRTRGYLAALQESIPALRVCFHEWEPDESTLPVGVETLIRTYTPPPPSWKLNPRSAAVVLLLSRFLEERRRGRVGKGGSQSSQHHGGIAQNHLLSEPPLTGSPLALQEAERSLRKLRNLGVLGSKKRTSSSNQVIQWHLAQPHLRSICDMFRARNMKPLLDRVPQLRAFVASTTARDIEVDVFPLLSDRLWLEVTTTKRD